MELERLDRFALDKLDCIRESANTILDIGETGKGLRDFFTGKDYKTLDVNSSAMPDIVADAHVLPFSDGSVDAIISFSTLYCLRSPQQFADECTRVLRSKGMILMSVPFMRPYCGGLNKGVYLPDYWRFTKDAIPLLFPAFELEISQIGGVMEGFRSFAPNGVKPLFRLLDRLLPRGNSTFGYYFYGIKK